MSLSPIRYRCRDCGHEFQLGYKRTNIHCLKCTSQNIEIAKIGRGIQ